MRLKEYMKQERLTAKHLADRANIHFNTVYKILNGKDVLFKTIVSIVTATKGKVSYKDLAEELK